MTRAVADRGKRPQIPEEASASPDVVALMERCWKQDPADRPVGFRPVVLELASVVQRVGDPRNTADAIDATSSSGEEHGDTTRRTGSDGIDASSRSSDSAPRPAGEVDPKNPPEQSNDPAPAESRSGADESAVEGGIPGSGGTSAPSAVLSVASADLPPSGPATSGRFKV